MAGTWTSNNWLFKPPSGPSYDSSFGTGFDRVDARLAREVWVGDSGFATFGAAITAIGATDKTVLRIPVGTHTLTAAVTVTSNIMLLPDIGAIIALGNFDLVINGPFAAGLYQVFSYTGTGKVLFGDKTVAEIRPEWWYSGSGDFSPALQAALDSRSDSTYGPNVVLGHGDYDCRTKVTVTQHNTRLIGQGRGSTTLTFTPAATQTLLEFAKSAGADSIDDCGLSDLRINIASGNTQTATCLSLLDARRFKLSRVQIYDPNNDDDGTVGSIGLYFAGRDSLTFRDSYINTSRPIVFDENPNATASKLVGDGSVLEAIELLTTNTTTGKNIEILDADMWITHFTMRKVHMNLGQYGFYWVSTTNTNAPLNWDIHGCRFEQATAGGVGLYISPKSTNPLYGLNVFNCIFAGTTGIKLQNTDAVTLMSCNAGSDNTTYLSIDTTCAVTTAINCYWGNGAISLGGCIQAFATTINAGIPAYAGERWFAQYVADDTIANQSLVINGSKVWHKSVQLTDDTWQVLPVTSVPNFKCAIVRAVAIKSDNSVAPEMGIFFLSPGRYVKLTGSANTATGDTDGSLCLNGYTIKNCLGYTADIHIVVEYMPS